MSAFSKFHKFIQGQINGSHFVDFDTSLIKVALVTSVYVPAQATHEFFSEVSANEVSGGNYTVGGLELTSKLVSAPDVNGVVKFSADPATWAVSGTGFTNARYAILYHDTTVATTSPLIAYLNLQQDYGNAAGDFTLRWDTAGIFTFS